ncbi:MAG: exonuclease SbcCD subunit D [Acidimicrobiia bacterium]|nr:exonuclease SbcCD subunit D [Acidimicrobiia bacterium]
MRILHTSDWHLGRGFHGVPLLDEQAEVIDRVVSLTVEHHVELVVIAGDLFDRAIPPASAVDLFDDALARLHATGACVVAISGNHDSAVRVGVNDRLLNEMGVAVRGQVGRITEPLVMAEPADGGPPVAVYLVPYLEPSVDLDLLTALAEPVPVAVMGSPAEAPLSSGRSDVGLADAGEEEGIEAVQVAGWSKRPNHDQVTRLAARAIRRHLGSLGPARSVVVAHTFVAGGAVSESERDLSVGGVERVAVDVFAGFDLVALGHLHQPQTLHGDRVAYSGSPLPYSFSEEAQVKSVRIVDLGIDGSVTAETVPLRVGRSLRTITGTLQDLLEDPVFDDAVDARVRARLTDPHLPGQAMARLRRRFPHAVELRHEPMGMDPSDPSVVTALATLESLAPLDLVLRFWAEQQGASATAPERRLLERAVAASLAAEP